MCTHKSLDGSLQPKHERKKKKKKKEKLPPNPEYKQASGGREAVKIVRAKKVDARWERKAGEQLKIRGMKKRGRSLEQIQKGSNISPVWP